MILTQEEKKFIVEVLAQLQWRTEQAETAVFAKNLAQKLLQPVEEVVEVKKEG